MLQKKKKKKKVRCCLVDQKEEDIEEVAGLGLCGAVMTIWRAVSVVEAKFK